MGSTHNHEDKGIFLDKTVYSGDQVSAWVVESVIQVNDLQDGKGIMCTVLVEKGLQSNTNHVRLDLDTCAKHFGTKLCQRLKSTYAERSLVVAYAENVTEGYNNLKELIMNEGWSRKIRKCNCSHDVSAGWKVLDQPSYFKAGYRYFQTTCNVCKKQFVNHKTAVENEYRVGTSSKVYFCAVEDIENCRVLMCAPCWEEFFLTKIVPNAELHKM